MHGAAARRGLCSRTIVKRVRVLVTDLPLMLRSIVAEALADRQEVELVSGEPSRRRGIDVLLTGAADPDDLDCARRLLAEWPTSRILLIASSGRHAVMYELYPRKMVLGDVSLDRLADVIREGFPESVV